MLKTPKDKIPKTPKDKMPKTTDDYKMPKTPKEQPNIEKGKNFVVFYK